MVNGGARHEFTGKSSLLGKAALSGECPLHVVNSGT